MRCFWLGVLCALLFWVGPVHALDGTTDEIELQNGAIGIVDPLAVTKGGTGVATLTDRAVIIGRGTADVEFATTGTAGRVLVDQGAGANPIFTAVDLSDTDAVTNTLPLGNGGTGVSSAADDTVLVSNGTIFEVKALPDCDSAINEALQYDTATNVWSCTTVPAGVTPLVGFSSLGDVCQGASCGASNNTVYASLGSVDSSESDAQMAVANATTFNNLICVASVAPGTGETYTVTMQDGDCTAGLAASANQICTISGTARTCTAATTAEAVSAGECAAWEIAGSDGAANAIVTCTVERTA